MRRPMPLIGGSASACYTRRVERADVKIIVIAGLIAVVASLFSALYYLYRDRATARAWSRRWRSASRCRPRSSRFLVVSYYLGWISPTGCAEPPTSAHRRERFASEPVDQHEEQQPDHVDEVPVPRGRLEGEVMVLVEVALERAPEHHREHDRADRHVRAVEARQHEERRAVDAGRQLQVERV